jgi:hypothetical protein
MKKIAPWNKLHEKIVDLVNASDHSVSGCQNFFRDRTYLWKTYGRYSPSPLGALPLSDELPLLHFLIEISEKKSAYQDLAFINRRLGNFDIAIHYAKKSINYEPDINRAESILELAISLFLSKKTYEAKRVISKLNKGEVSTFEPSVIYWFHRINGFKETLSTNILFNLIKSNPLLLVDYLKNRTDQKYEFYCILKDRIEKYLEIFDQECLMFFLIEDNFFGTTCLESVEVSSALEKFISTWKSELVLKAECLSNLLKVFGKRKVIEMLSEGDVIPLTSEMMDRVFSQFSRFSIFLNSHNIASHEITHNKKNSDDYDEIIKTIMFEDYVLKDANTSNYNSRFYSLNLRINKTMNDFIRKELGSILDRRFQDSKVQFSEVGVNIGESYDIWFDASYTYGGSKINNHLHTASYGRSFLYTVVFYLCVPPANPGEGEIVIHAKDKDISMLPTTGSIVSFPPWFWHETTPINAGDLRVTINVDIFSKDQVFIPVSLFND